MTEELDLGAEELALAALGEQLLRAQPSEHLAHMSDVLLLGAAEHEDVVEEHQHTAVEQVSEGVVHELHEGTGRVAQAHGQHEVLKAAVARAEGRLLDVGVGHADLMEARAQVDLSEVLRSVHAVEQLVHQRQRILVLDRHLVEAAVVDDDSGRAILLTDDQSHGTVRRRAHAQLASFDQRASVLLEHGEVLGALMAQRASRRWPGAGLELDGVLHATRGRQAVGQLVREHVCEFLEQRLRGGVFLGRRRGCGLWLHKHGEQVVHKPALVGAAEALEGDGSEARHRRLIVDALKRLDEARRSTLVGRANRDGAVGPSDDRVVRGQPGHAQDGVVALEGRGGEGRGERDVGSLGSSQGEVGYRTSLGKDDRAVGEFDGAVGRREREPASAGEGGIDELARRSAVEQQRGSVSGEEATQLEQGCWLAAYSVEFQRRKGRGRGGSLQGRVEVGGSG